jgi:hypothetical protein
VVLGNDSSAADAPAEARVRAAASRAFAAFPRPQRIANMLRTQHSVEQQTLGAMLPTRAGGLHRAPDCTLTAIVDASAPAMPGDSDLVDAADSEALLREEKPDVRR